MQDAWNATAQDFKHYLRSRGKADQTIRTYTYVASLFWRWCYQREIDPCELDKRGFRHWISDRTEKVSPRRLHNDVAAMRLFFEMLREDGRREDDPTVGVHVKRSDTLPTEPISREEFRALIQACDSERDRLIVMMMGYSGLRIAEVAALRAEDIDWNQSLITVRHGKGDKERRVAVNPEVLNWLRAYLGMFPEGALWRSESRVTYGEPLAISSIRQVIYDAAERAGVEDVHPHRFRSMYGTEMIRQHGDIQALQGQMGHSSIETTARYTYWTREQRGIEQSRALNLEAAGG